MADTTYYVIHRRTGHTEIFHNASLVASFTCGRILSFILFVKVDEKGERVVDVSSCSDKTTELEQILEKA
jgi:hypothetical protein